VSTFLEQAFNGLVSGSFYALLALGLAVIFGMLRVVNFAHGALYMLGAFGAVLLARAGLGLWAALLVVPIVVAAGGMLLERLFVHRLTPVFGFGCALAGLAGVLAAPMRAVNSGMGADLIVVVFAVVVIGGLGSVFGSVVAGFLIGMLQALGNLYLPVLSQTSTFVLMAVVLLLRPAGLFGKEEHR